MKNQLTKKCQICRKDFKLHDLYPNTLIRNSAYAFGEAKYPHLSREGFVCFSDLHELNGMYYEEVLKKEKGLLSALDDEVIESLKKHEILAENVNEEFDEGLTFGERWADKMAKFGGSWTFISCFVFVLVGWMAVNSYQQFYEAFDPYPFILLNLVLSSLAAIQAPVIMMSQNRHSSKDRLSQENDYQVNLKAELQIRQLNTRLDLFMKRQWEEMYDLSETQKELLKEISHLRRK